MFKCDLCKRTDFSTDDVPMIITVFGELADDRQLAYEVCVDCYTDRHLEILELLKKNKKEYS